VRAEVAGGEITAWRWSAEAEAVPGAFRGSAVRGADADRAGAGAGAPLALAVISPAVVEILLVKEEIAQPVQEAASLDCGVLIRGAPVVEASEVFGGGKIVSAIVEANLRIRWR